MTRGLVRLFCLSLLALVGCAPTQIPAFAPTPTVVRTFASKDSGRIFVSRASYGTNGVLMFGFPSGMFLGAVAPPPEGFAFPGGECEDSAGNVYVANQIASTIDQFNDRGTFIRSLKNPGELPMGCSVSAATGDVAAVDRVSNSGYPAAVAVFHKGKGPPEVLRSPDWFTISYIAFDGVGNFFFDGSRGPVGTDQYGEVPKGTVEMKVVTFDRHLYPEQLQFSGGAMAIGSLHQRMFRVKGLNVLGSTQLAHHFYAFFIAGHRLLALRSPKPDRYVVDVYAYPHGTEPVRSVTLQYDFGYAAPNSIVLTP